MYDEVCLQCFLDNQLKLFPEKVAESLEEAEEFLEDCMAVVCKNVKEVKAYWEGCGIDISRMSIEEIKESEEVFELPDGRFLIVEG